MDWARNTFGQIPLQNERYEQLTTHDSLKLRNRLMEITNKLTDLSLDFTRNEQWDFFMVTYAGTHRGG